MNTSSFPKLRLVFSTSLVRRRKPNIKVAVARSIQVTTWRTALESFSVMLMPGGVEVSMTVGVLDDRREAVNSEQSCLDIKAQKSIIAILSLTFLKSSTLVQVV